MGELEIYKGMIKKMKDDEIKEFNEEIYVEMLENGELYDYITNLQQENERLKVNCNIGNENLTFYRNGYKDYKSRCEKAVEIYDDTITYLTTINAEYMDSNTKKTIQDIVNKLEKELDVLNGRE